MGLDQVPSASVLEGGVLRRARPKLRTQTNKQKLHFSKILSVGFQKRGIFSLGFICR
jgi:hypothetical protein